MNEVLLQNAVRLHQAGKLDEAARAYGRLIESDPRNFQALYFLGFIRFQLGEFALAEQLIGKATDINPSLPDAFYNRGCALQQLKRDEEALVCFDRALALKRDYSEALFNRGTSLLTLARFSEALASFDAALTASPRDAEAWHNRGDALAGLRRTAEAISSYTKALALAPDTVKSLSKRARAFQTLKHYEEAAADYDKLLKLDPEFEYSRGNLIYCRLHCCDWRSLEQDRATIADGILLGKNVISPLQHIVFTGSADDQRRCSEFWATIQSPPVPDPLWQGERYGHDKIRIAYLSGDFRTHAVSLLIAGVMEEHDRSSFEIVGMSFGADDNSPTRTRLKGAFDRFIDIDAIKDGQAARLLRENEIDIAVDLMGITGGCRTGIFAFRPAPIQVNFLGFPGTIGTDFMDYIIADRIVIPEGQFSGFAENVVHLPDSFQPNDSKRRASHNAPTRAQAGLPDDAFVFCSFNNSCKIMPETFDVWMRLLRQIENSIFWLPEYNPAEARNLKREAAARGIAPERIVFAPLVPTPEDYLARMNLADLFLDTLPYGAHTTASDALWMGLPVLTCIGTSFAGRVAVSLLHAIGLPEMITNSYDEYEAAAIKLAQTPALLSRIKEKLARDRETSSLFDTVRYTRRLENAYRSMWERYQRGEPPAHFAVPAL